ALPAVYGKVCHFHRILGWNSVGSCHFLRPIQRLHWKRPPTKYGRAILRNAVPDATGPEGLETLGMDWAWQIRHLLADPGIPMLCAAPYPHHLLLFPAHNRNSAIPRLPVPVNPC